MVEPAPARWATDPRVPVHSTAWLVPPTTVRVDDATTAQSPALVARALAGSSASNPESPQVASHGVAQPTGLARRAPVGYRSGQRISLAVPTTVASTCDGGGVGAAAPHPASTPSRATASAAGSGP